MKKDDPKTIKKEMKATVERVFAGTSTLEDRHLLQHAILSGMLVVSPTDRLPAKDISNAIVIQGSRNLGMEVDGLLYELLRDRVFPKPPGVAPPFLPSIFIGREEALHDIKSLLGITERPSSKNNVVIVRGWPGVGKTTLISVLGRDADVLTAFPNGVLWTSLSLKPGGGEPNLLSEMVTWGRALGTDEILRAPTLAEASEQLRYLLQNRRMLLILDGVWEAKHAIPFLKAAGTDCVTLITTHTTSVAIELAPTPQAIYVLPVLTEETAFNLLRIISPRAVKKYPNECRELVRGLEYLPLALHVAGRVIDTEMQTGFGLKRVLKDIQDGAAIIMARAPADRIEGGVQPTVQAILKKSTDLLDEFTRECFAYLGAFAPKPATFDLKALKFMWQVEDPLPIARKLVAHGMLEPAGAGRYQMHALLVQYARSLLG